MFRNSSKSHVATPDGPVTSPRRVWWLAVVLPVWVLVGFFAAQVIVALVVALLSLASVSLESLNPSIVSTSFAGAVYLISLLIVIGIPWLILRRRTSLKEIGLDRLPTWTDILLAPAALIVYMVLSALLLALAISFIPGFDPDQAQETGFSQLNYQYEYILAFLTLVILAPVAEEILFRGYLLSKLQRAVPVWLAVLIVSVLFGLVHAIGTGTWNVALDTFALSLLLCTVRLVSGRLWPAILLHMLKNGLAFYLLFINPMLLNTLGG